LEGDRRALEHSQFPEYLFGKPLVGICGHLQIVDAATSQLPFSVLVPLTQRNKCHRSGIGQRPAGPHPQPPLCSAGPNEAQSPDDCVLFSKGDWSQIVFWAGRHGLDEAWRGDGRDQDCASVSASAVHCCRNRIFEAAVEPVATVDVVMARKAGPVSLRTGFPRGSRSRLEPLALVG
jgi:hypothetical protein